MVAQPLLGLLVVLSLRVGKTGGILLGAILGTPELGRGFMGVAAMYFGAADPVRTTVGCLVFGLADSIGAKLQPFGVPSQIILLMPYVVTVLVLWASIAVKNSQERRRKSSLSLK